jgi:hypothetical protein
MLHPPEFSALVAAEIPSSEAGRILARHVRQFGLEGSFRTSRVLLTCRKILRHGADGFTSLPKEVVLRIFIALKYPSSSAGFEPVNLMSNGKNNNHYTIENDSWPWLECVSN